MLSFLAKKVPRTITANQNPVVFDGGRSFIEFKAPTDRYLVINRWPPSSSDANRNIALRPPHHWHRHQTETFHVLEGTAEFLCDGQKIIKKAGDLIIIPTKAIHTFHNLSETHELLIEFVLEPQWRERDESFFRTSTLAARTNSF
jgi:mannose-6-phosphate isomerase-like protein (cupin superfamily)